MSRFPSDVAGVLLLMALLVVAVVAVPVFMLAREWVRRRRQHEHQRRGFEVKLTGEMPVTEKKENDHG